MNNTTYSAKNGEIESKWYIIDAANKPLGRVATEAAKLLRGKHKPTFTPNIDTGDHVIIINFFYMLLNLKLPGRSFKFNSYSKFNVNILLQKSLFVNGFGKIF